MSNQVIFSQSYDPLSHHSRINIHEKSSYIQQQQKKMFKKFRAMGNPPYTICFIQICEKRKTETYNLKACLQIPPTCDLQKKKKKALWNFSGARIHPDSNALYSVESNFNMKDSPVV